MLKNLHFTRRDFMGMLGSSSLLSFAPALRAFDVSPAGTGAPKFAYAASSGKNATHGIFAFTVHGGRWEEMQFTPSESPSALALSPDNRFLFVANRVRKFQNLPTASVEAYRIDSITGKLTLINRQSLALSAIEPGHLAVSPDGKYLAVSVTGGGAYNVLPIRDDGHLLPVTALRKEVGSGLHPERQASSQPQQIAFDESGRLITADFGTDRISVFEIDDDSLSTSVRTEAKPGSGPSMMASHQRHSLLFIGNALDGTITSHRYNFSEGQITPTGITVEAASASGLNLCALAMHPRENCLYSVSSNEDTSSLTLWRFHPDSGHLQHARTLTCNGALGSLAVSQDGSQLFAADTSNGKLVAIDSDTKGKLTEVRQLANVPSPSAFVLWTSKAV